MKSIIKDLVSICSVLSEYPRIVEIYEVPDKNKHIMNIEMYSMEKFNRSEFGKAFYETILYLDGYYKSMQYDLCNCENSIKSVFDSIENIVDVFFQWLSSEKSNDFMFITYDFQEEDMELIMRVHALLLFFSVTFNADIGNLDVQQLICSEDNQDVFYRGHSKCTYKLIPSMYRKLSTPRNHCFNRNLMENLYQEKGYYEKYCCGIGHENMGYDFCSFMQHNVAYSPLLDFTEDYHVALSFATHKYDEKYDAEIIKLVIPETEIVSDRDLCESYLDKLSIYITSGKLGVASHICRKPLLYCTPHDFDIRVVLFNLKNNDKMKFQKGVFLMIYRGVIVNGEMLLPICNPYIKKLGIKAKDKMEIYKKTIEEQPYCSYDFLMNPRLYFES